MCVSSAKMIQKVVHFLIILCSVVPYLASQNVSHHLLPYLKLNQIHQQWLEKFSILEMAHMLRYPPFSYWAPDISNSFLNDATNLSNTFTLPPFSLNPNEEPHTKCSYDLTNMLTNLGSSWVLEMIDSYGKLQSGITEGSVVWPGNFKECLSVHGPPADDDHEDFHGKYCITTWQIKGVANLPELPLSTGICIPDSCEPTYIKNVLSNVLRQLETLPVFDKLKTHLKLQSVTCKYDSKSPDGPVIAFATIILLYLLLVVFGTTVSVLSKKSKRTPIMTHPFYQNFSKVEADIECSSEAKDLSVECRPSVPHSQVLINAEPHLTSEVKKFTMTEFLKCFCVFTNGAKILNTNVPSGQLTSLHGIRFLSLTWVIMGHTYISSVAMIDNKLEVLKDINNFPFQMVMQAPFSVDSFFFLSGFLVTYLFLKEMEKRNGKMNWLYFYFHRIWRLTPVYFIVVLFYILIFKYIGSGPFWDENYGDNARHTIWMYLLYINNFIPVNDMAVGWSWYLANDMQFYVISPLFLYPLYKWPKIGISVIVSLLCASWVTTGLLSYRYDLIPMFVGVAKAQNLTQYQDRMWFSFDVIYDKPYCRIGPYLIGALLGYIMLKIGNRRRFLSWYTLVIGWILAIFCSASVIFGLYQVNTDIITGTVYNTLCRSSFSIGLAWLVFVCETNHASFLHKLLSFKFWIPLSRLTFCAYLVHCIIIHGYYQSLQVVLYFTQTTMVLLFFGFLTAGYILAFFVSVIFESPMLNVEKLLLKRA